MSGIFGAQTKWLDATFTTAPTPGDYILLAVWYNRTVDAARFDDNLIRLKNSTSTQQLYISNFGGTSDPRIDAVGNRGSSTRSANQPSDMVEGTWRLAGALLPPSVGDISEPMAGWDNGNLVTIELPLGAVSGNVDYFSLGQGGNFNSYSFWHGRLAEAAVFTVGSQLEAETIMTALETATADSITLPAGSTLLAYYPLLSDATAVVGPALANHGSVTFDDTDHPDLGGGAPSETITMDKWYSPLQVARAAVVVAGLQQFGAFDPTPVSTPESITLDKWYRDLNAPVLRKALTHRVEFAIDPARLLDPEAVSIDRWLQPLAEPLRRRASMADFLAFPFDIATPPPAEDITLDKWFTPLSEPARKREVLREGGTVKAAWETGFDITADMWFQLLSEPTRRIHQVVQGRDFQIWDPLFDVQPEATEFAWFAPLDQPYFAAYFNTPQTWTGPGFAIGAPFTLHAEGTVLVGVSTRTSVMTGIDLREVALTGISLDAPMIGIKS